MLKKNTPVATHTTAPILNFRYAGRHQEDIIAAKAQVRQQKAIIHLRN